MHHLRVTEDLNRQHDSLREYYTLITHNPADPTEAVDSDLVHSNEQLPIWLMWSPTDLDGCHDYCY